MERPLFPRWANGVFRWAILTIVGAFLGFFTLLWVLVRTPYFTGEEDQPAQPVKFDHRHHVRDDGIDCLYCHYTAETSPFAGIPAASQCMGCHAQVWTQSPELALVRASYFDGTPIRWKRVTSIPDFTFFNHSIHVSKGVGCVTCHGRVDEMAEVYQARRLSMEWCLDCHRAPERYLRPRSKVTDMAWTPGRPEAEVGRELARKEDVHPTTDCSGCHR